MTELSVIAENDWLIALDKPAGLIAHSDGRTVEDSLARWIGERFPALRGVGGHWISPQGEHVPLNGLVHRLDRTTSGLVIAAKNDEAFAYLRQQFKDKRVEKRYLAWVYGKPSQDAGRIVAEIMRSSDKPKRWYARETSEDDPRAAITDWNVLQSKENASLLEVTPRTGRTHQIRVHLSHIGCPIVSDHLYAAERQPMLGFTRSALHAEMIALTLPDETRGEYHAPLPQDFEAATLA
jgi:23S rRNA pseudouridine1911/1915/1917 synthase